MKSSGIRRTRSGTPSRALSFPSSFDAGANARLFAALGDQNRLRLIARLTTEGPLSITSLRAGLRITRQAVTKHLHHMEQAGLVLSHRRGRERLWQLQQRRLEQARRYLDQISAQWDAALERLRAFVED